MNPCNVLAEAIGESLFFTNLLIGRIAARLGIDKDTLAIKLLEVVKELKK